MEVKKVKLSEIAASEYNPRRDLQPTERSYQNIKNSLEAFGLVVPIIINKRTNTIVSGHQRYKILVESGETKADVVLIDLPPEKEKALNIALNKVKGQWDIPKLGELLKEFDEEQLSLTGFDASEIEELTKEFEEELEKPNEPNGLDEEEEEAEESISKPEFLIYLSFADKASAEKWLKQRNIDKEFGGGNNININVRGESYEIG